MKKKVMVPEIDGVSYVVDRVLGEGGTALVFKVRSMADGTTYALKRIEKDSRKRNERFRNEIAFGMKARHGNVLRIHATAEDEAYFYYTMDLYPNSLRHIIAEEFDHQVLLDYVTQLCDGLTYVHDEGITHRDLKPENILVNPGNKRLVLADFGIAHFKNSNLTQRNDLLANRNYQAPEQMAKKDARGIGKPADIFALGLIVTEMFTKEHSRGVRHRRIGDVHPFLAELDVLVEKMMLQDESRRISVEAVRDSLHWIRKQVDSSMEEIRDDLRANIEDSRVYLGDAEPIIQQAASDILSAKFIFERTTDEGLSRYNWNYHCEINYNANPELFNGCVQSKLYSVCKAKFEYEANVSWNESDLDLVVSPRKAQLLSEFESIQRQYPLVQNSIWGVLVPRAAHYFRFCKDYHCAEILTKIRGMLSRDGGELYRNLMNAPIIWIAGAAREYLKTDFFEMSPQNLKLIEFERQVGLYWEGTSLDDFYRRDVGADLFKKRNSAESVIGILKEFGSRWDASLTEQDDGSYSIYFRSHDEYMRFREEALTVAAPHLTFRDDVLDILRPADEYDDLIALTWEPRYDIQSTLAKVLKMREI